MRFRWETGGWGRWCLAGIEEELLQLNEDTLWSGHPREWNNPDAKRHLPEVRKLVLEEQKYLEADQVCKKMQGPYNESYLPLGNLRIEFGKADGGGGVPAGVESGFGGGAGDIPCGRCGVHAGGVCVVSGAGSGSAGGVYAARAGELPGGVG